MADAVIGVSHPGWARTARAPADGGGRGSDDALTLHLQAAAAGDELAFAIVYRDVQPRLLRYLTALAGPAAEDVAAETWFHVTKDLARFQGDIDGFRGWVATIGRNRALDHHRAASRRPVSAADDSELAAMPGGADTEAEALAALSTQDAVATIAALPRDQAEAVMLRAVVGLDVKATAEILGKSEGSVRVAAHRGLKKLARNLRTAQ